MMSRSGGAPADDGPTRLFDGGRAAAKDYERWRSEKPRIEQSALVGHNQHGQASSAAQKRQRKG